MKVVAVSNFGFDTVREQLIAENLTQADAEHVAAYHNKDMHEESTYFHVIKPDGYVLWRGMADLVGDIK